MGAKIANNKSARKYGAGASKKVAKVMHEFKHGTLLSGRSKKTSDESQTSDCHRTV